ncbi:hypothetical protein TNCV_1387251 [Trichonephila clavipes]|nr:hypothetical protein TNCV_1387251 [Trichonephila clavipes]
MADCEVEGAIASPLSIPPERAMSPTGERSDEGRNIRTRQNPLGPQEWQTRIGRAIVPDDRNIRGQWQQPNLQNDEAHFWLNGYVNKQNCRIWSEANPQVYVETPLHPEKLTVWCALWAGGILLQKR